MPKTAISKAIGAAFGILTVSVLGSIVTMVIFYKIEISQVNVTYPPTDPSTTVGPPPVMRLPTNLMPWKYKIFLQPYLYSKIIEEVNVTSPNQTMLFTGNSTVYFHCVEPTKSIYLHSQELRVFDPLVKNETIKKDIRIIHMEYHGDESDFLEIQLKDTLKKGMNYSLFLAFEGEISQNLQALYVSTYHEGIPHSENTKRFIASTHLEPTDARRVFPCFDEPEMKAVFDVTIIHRKETRVLANEYQAENYRLDPDWQVTRFYQTRRMSTYLFAFTVSELEYLELNYDHRVEIKIFARPDATDAGHTQYALDVTVKILKFYEDYLGIEYPLRKLDEIALPDLPSRAMENWGLITYKEGGLLYEEGVSSLLHKETISLLIAHELAHQWFGNLVTMKWWSEIWLNEGFATYMSTVALDKVEPAFQVKEIHITNQLHTALEQDALASSHPLSVPENDVQSTSEIVGMFDAISYFKGAIVLRMLADVVGQSDFDKGIKDYLKVFSYGNTNQYDLWHYIQKAHRPDFDVAKMMETWTNQRGYPVITVNTTNGQVTQSHFLFNSSLESNLTWYIPIQVMSNTTASSLSWLRSKTSIMTPFISKHGEWILANVNCNGYYRVNYNPENWERLLIQLDSNPDRIPVMNRGQLIDDAFNLARAKMIDVTLALNTTVFLHKETAYIPWESAVRNLDYFIQMFDRSDVYGSMQTYLRNQVENLFMSFKNFTDNPEVLDHSSQQNQIIAIDVACSNGLPECTEMATRMFDNWMNSDENNTKSIHQNLRSVIYCQGVAAGGKDEWEFAWKTFQETTETSEKDQLRKALACTKQIWLLSRYLDYTLDPKKIRLMDVTSTINYIATNVVGHGMAWDFMRANWDYVSQGDAVQLIETVTKRFSTPFELEELEIFAVNYDLGTAYWAVEQAIEQVKVNIQWVSENKDAVSEWFATEEDDF
ncbi:alanyl (membrane) aminopeptidase-like b [Corythoichthys intestinalis]|uniref:alanyl (membrane) aminopeptidase-like b n=1 Tax=Corythoichthys intestinalis TaxID=161448 RepID=UPI0025A5436C|nr:alanyl (membrane) aminopeptidase-like b [Corythoichthys intestinalis]XP_061813058.1 aminopeptidase N-like [Nerophis lumbriciformis]